MKKRLESELISIAHRILKLKNKSEVDQLYKETQKLYETLSVLKFYQENFESVKSELSSAVLEEKLEQHFEDPITKETGFYVNPVQDSLVEPKLEAVIEPEEETKKEPEIISDEAIEAVDEPEEEAIVSDPAEILEEDEEVKVNPQSVFWFENF